MIIQMMMVVSMVSDYDFLKWFLIWFNLHPLSYRRVKVYLRIKWTFSRSLYETT